MVLRDLSERRVGGGDNFNYLTHRDIGDLGAAIGFGHGHAPQAALRERV